MFLSGGELVPAPRNFSLLLDRGCDEARSDNSVNAVRNIKTIVVNRRP
jgi:hypothetical protein